MKYLKTWIGTTVNTGGCGMGDNGGHPARRFQIIDNFRDLDASFDEDAEYYKLHPVDVKSVIQIIRDLT